MKNSAKKRYTAYNNAKPLAERQNFSLADWLCKGKIITQPIAQRALLIGHLPRRIKDLSDKYNFQIMSEFTEYVRADRTVTRVKKYWLNPATLDQAPAMMRAMAERLTRHASSTPSSH